MSIDKCLKNGVSGGELTRKQAKDLKQLYDGYVKRNSRDGAASAQVKAKAQAIRALEAESLLAKRRKALAVVALKRIDNDLGPDAGNSAIALLEHMGDGLDGYSFSSVEGRRKALLGQAHERMEELLHEFRRGALGGDFARHNKARLANVVAEAFGEDTGDQAAKGLARAWTETAEWLRRRFNDAGGAIGKLENWGLPQAHNARALYRRGRDGWISDIAPLLDRARMKHPLTGDPVSEDEFVTVLENVWETIVSDGWSKREPQKAPAGKGAIAGQHAEHRFLVFKNADAWMEYQRQFGEGDPFSAMMGHINIMARDIAALEILGPNPAATIEWLKQTIEKEASNVMAGKPGRFKSKPHKALDRARRRQNRLEQMWEAYRGTLETPVDQRMATGFAVTRNWITASVLGQAVLSSVSDVGTQMVSRSFAGIPAARTGLDIIAEFTPGARREAVAAGLILDNALHVFHAQARYAGTIEGPVWSSYLADRVLTWSGLTAWTQGTKHAFGKAILHELGKRVNDSLAALPSGQQRILRRYGFTARDWDQLRKAEVYTSDGVPFLRPREIRAVDQRLADRYLEMVLQETEYATPSGSLRSRALLVGGSRPGTWAGEARRSFAQFKSFGAAFLMTHGLRMAMMLGSSEKGMRATGARYAGALLFSTTIFGAAAIQLKQLAAGRDPRPGDNVSFWGAALLQGGGLGLYGDFLFSDLNRYGGGFARTLAGPTVERISDLWTLTGGNLVQGAAGEETNFGRELSRFIRGNIPGGNLWYVRQAYERVLMDQLQYLMDPDANKAFKRQQQKWKREFGQEFYWKPGQAAPARLPDFGAALGQ